MARLRTLRAPKTSVNESNNPGPVSTLEESVPAAALSESVQTPATSHEDIAARAYARFLARGCQHGDDWDDWFHAEAEVRREQVQTRRFTDHQ